MVKAISCIVRSNLHVRFEIYNVVSFTARERHNSCRVSATIASSHL